MSDDPVSECESCGGLVQRVLFPVAVHFKGSGFYTTDYARKSTLTAGNGNGNGNGGGSDGSNVCEKAAECKSDSPTKSSCECAAAGACA
jgi:predicted nucleic acid-binding Zn ribbon protein